MSRNKSNDIQKRVYENEIKRLTKERDEYIHKYEVANQYKAQYEELVNDYKQKLFELDKLKLETDSLNNELRITIESLKKKYS